MPVLSRSLALALALSAACVGDPVELPAVSVVVCPSAAATPDTGSWGFVDVTAEVGLVGIAHRLEFETPTQEEALLGAVVGGDIDDDCWPDLVVDRGQDGIAVFRNRGDGTFEDVTVAMGLDAVAGPVGTLALADFSGDGWLDLFVGGFGDRPSRTFVNDAGERFDEVPRPGGLTRPTYGAHFFDFDGTGGLDLFAAHWVLDLPRANREYLFTNNGEGWSDVTEPSGLEGSLMNHTLSPRAVDLNGDGHLDLVVAADFGQSAVFLNDGRGAWVEATTAVISDQNGMGTATGDVNGDGHVDWFVTAIKFDNDDNGRTPRPGGWGGSGNRLYLGDGEGGFVDGTDDAGVRDGSWGWGACMHDFDLDGDLDIYHGTGWHHGDAEFAVAPSRFFTNDGNGAFVEQAAALGIDDRSQGRGVSCVDIDRDGDLDLVLANHNQPLRVYRNTGAKGHWLTVRLRLDSAANRLGIGTRITVRAGGRTQVRDLGPGSNFQSHDPFEAHFGLGDATTVDRLEIDGVTVLERLEADRTITVVVNR